MIKKLLLVSAFLLSGNAYSASEDWYFTASIGGANNTNPADVENVISGYENLYGARTSLSVDIGVYFPMMDDSLLVGFVSNVSSDNVSTYYGANIITHNASHFGLSAMKFIGSEAAEGLFLRGDFGLASSDYTYYNNTLPYENGDGTAALVGVGFSLPVSSESRIIFSLNFVNRTIDNQDFRSTQLMVGGMW